MYEGRIKHLEQLHYDLNKRIDDMEKNHPHVDETHVHDWKKQRLRIKDELSRLRRLQHEATMSRELDDWPDDR